MVVGEVILARAEGHQGEVDEILVDEE